MRRRLIKFVPLLALVGMLVACGGATGSTGTGNTGNAGATANTSKNTPSTTGNACTTPPGGNDAFSVVANQSTASYRVQEKFLNRDLPNDAIGKTQNVKGGFLLTSGSQPAITAMKISADLSTLKSDEDRRDNSIRERWLESNTYPQATFVAKDVQTLPANYSQGQNATFNITGNLTIHNVTRQETFKVTGKKDGDTISGQATSLIYMKNYGFDAPNIAGILTVKDGVTVTFDFNAKKGNCDPTV
jgi:polyisoprenoid-binding protein YceI